ncbi:MAG: sigma-70 family RNA polymerase sigma factor [Planctomycetaceae bacterium]|nr:sigma-70 family RNA polymerase sigma factor [Planctomycetaceae bacterium]
MSETEAQLVERCLSGEESALAEFVQQYQALVFGLCFRMLQHRQDAEDVAQEIFLRAFRALNRWDPTRPIRPWLMKIAANRCRTALQVRGRKKTVPLPPEQSENTTSDLQSAADLAEELQQALATLREDYRLCFLLYHHQELSVAEISDVLDCPEGTIKTWLHRARRLLADRLSRRGVTPDAERALQGI